MPKSEIKKDLGQALRFFKSPSFTKFSLGL